MDKIFNIKIDRAEVYDFCDLCKTFDCDIDLIDGSTILDAKDCDHVALLALNKTFCVSLNSNDKNEILSFNGAMERYKTYAER